MKQIDRDIFISSISKQGFVVRLFWRFRSLIFRNKKLYKIGSPVRIDRGFHCTTKLEIGNYVHIGPMVTCVGGEDSKFICKGFNNIMAGAHIICASDRFDGSGLFGALIPNELKGRQINEPVIVEEFANVGTDAIMMPGSRLRKGALLTVNSVLFGDTEEWGIYKGNPAVFVKKIDGTKIVENAKRLRNG